MKLVPVLLIVGTLLLAGCNATTPTPQPTAAPSTVPSAVPANTLPPSPVPPSSTPNTMGLNIVAAFDPTSQVLTIYGTTPGATVVLGGTPLLPPPTPTEIPTLPPTETPQPTNTSAPRVFVPRPTSTTAAVVDAAALRGKIIFKSTRDGGAFPTSFSYYAMNPDGSGIQKLDYAAANPLYISLSSREGYSPDGNKVVLGERRCWGGGMTCSIYILDTQMDAALINSSDDISHGEFVQNKGFQAKDPVWSPSGQYIVFVSNHESGQGCVKSSNIFKASTTTRPVIKRMTSGSDFCAGGQVGHPSFSSNSAQVAFWSEGSGMKQIYLLDVGGDDNFDWRLSNPHMISNRQSDDWDPLWVK